MTYISLPQICTMDLCLWSACFHLCALVIQWYWFVVLILTFYRFAHMCRLQTKFWLSVPVLSTLLSLPCLPWKSGICATEEAKQRILQHMSWPGYLDREECCCWSWCGNCMHIPNFFSNHNSLYRSILGGGGHIAYNKALHHIMSICKFFPLHNFGFLFRKNVNIVYTI